MFEQTWTGGDDLVSEGYRPRWGAIPPGGPLRPCHHLGTQAPQGTTNLEEVFVPRSLPSRWRPHPLSHCRGGAWILGPECQGMNESVTSEAVCASVSWPLPVSNPFNVGLVVALTSYGGGKA